MTKIRTQINIEPDQYEWLKEKAYKDRLALSEIIRMVIEFFRKHEHQKPKVD